LSIPKKSYRPFKSSKNTQQIGVLAPRTLLRGWSSQNEALETNFPNFIFMPFLQKYGKLQAFWYSFYFDTWPGKHFLMSSKIFRMKKVKIS
jgi:hypothetical protein